MSKLRLAVVATLLLIAGLVLALSRMSRHRTAGTSGAALASASASSAPLALPAVTASAQPSAAVPPSDLALLPDGRPVPPLPATAPRSVGLGVVLVTYEGVQLAPRNARSKTEALRLATELVELAKTDFAAAVQKGDPGSMSDAGSVPRGVLEPATEYLLFTLEKGQVSPAPVVTPRGYWVMRRNR